MKTHRRNSVATLATLAMLAITVCLVSGCAMSIGDKGECEVPPAVQPTKGQELTDLKKAYDEGVITEAEYQQGKARILTE